MAKSYYKQSERPVVQPVNWGEISSNLSEKLLAEQKRREDLKIKLDEESRDYIRTFNDAPQGQHDGANERMARFASDASAYMLDLDKKLKSGQLPLRQYMSMRANLKQGTEDMFDVSKRFNESYAASLERANSGLASAEEIYQNEKIQAFGDPANSSIYIDPLTGQMSVAKMVDDGSGNLVMSTDMNDRKSIFTLKNTVERKIDKYDVNKFADTISSSYTNEYKKILMEGNVKDIDDLKKNENFIKATNDLVQRELVNTHNAASILTDRANVDYKFVELDRNELPDKPEEGVIYLVPDPTNPNSGATQPLLTKKQEEEAATILRSAIDSKIGVTETARAEENVREAQDLANEQLRNEINYYNRTRDLKFEELETKVEGDKQRIEIVAQKTPLELERLGLDNKKLKQLINHLAKKNPKELEQMDISIGNLESIIEVRDERHKSDMAKAKTEQEKLDIELKYYEDKLKLNNKLLDTRVKTEDKSKNTVLKDFSSYVDNKYNLNPADINNEEKVKEELELAYGDLLFKFDETGMGSDEIKITSPDGEKTITIPLSNPNANELIHSFINLNTPTETIARISKSGKLPKSKQKDTDNTTSIDTSSY
ncbi:MAG: hypothetical protein Unbinned8138contig1000_48 [Prokaryotic dsDNA virus sp.]|nr:MAG: hypothetical protein Unbinned8138contig1000_48 [Prokaryotic dsDNA virus sp.]|tara:strand:- start:514 stop:2316 length:1803 start_codon:yes stop_codon:yes gene_type:complete